MDTGQLLVHNKKKSLNIGVKLSFDKKIKSSNSFFYAVKNEKPSAVNLNTELNEEVKIAPDLFLPSVLHFLCNINGDPQKPKDEAKTQILNSHIHSAHCSNWPLVPSFFSYFHKWVLKFPS